MKNTILLLVTVLAFNILLFSQERGTITGRIVDAKTGEEIIGANVILEGTTLGAATDLDGKYIIANVPAGIYNLNISYLSYSKTKITNVEVTAGKTTTVNSALSPEAISVGEIVVTDKRDNSYESALLNQQKKSISISDGISAEQIKRSTDAASSDALRRVTGISLVDNKFIYVRGTSERYSNALMNNTSLPGTEPDKKSFAFDLIPTNLLENTVIVKSFTPDVPGDFSGGLVKLNTIDFPNKLTVRVSYSSSYNNNTSLKSFKTYSGGKNDWLGIDDGTRNLPLNFPASLANGLTTQQINEFAKTLNNTWAPTTDKAPINNNFSLSIGDGATLIGQDFGFITSISYKNNFNTSEIERNEYEANGEKRFGYKGTQSTHSVLWGGLFNLSYKLNNLHKLSFKNTYTHTSDDEVAELLGAQYSDAGSEQMQTALRFVSRSVLSSQVMGEHSLPMLNNLKVEWHASFAEAERDEPDYRRVSYSRTIGSDEPFAALLGFQANLKNGGRFFSDMYEKSRSGKIDFSMPLASLKIKFGALYEDKSRNFNSRLIGVIVNAPGNGFTDFSLLYQPLDKIFSHENFRKNGFSLSEYVNGSNNYKANQEVSAVYFMAEMPTDLLGNDFILIGGGRLENSNQQVNSLDLSGQKEVNITLHKADLLPSLNLIYKLNEATNLRLAYSQTVNRPELRELAPFAYFDFSTQTSIRGNKNLNRAIIRNYDFRYEVYPTIGELLSASLFYKSITDAIEQVVVTGSALGSERTFLNSDKAVNYGFEVEARFSLHHITDFLSDFSINGNYAWIKSDVTVKGSETTIARRNRPLQGQSPYVLNLGLTYLNPDFGTLVTLLYNRIGNRITEVATAYEEDVIEQSRDLIDITITQPITENLEMKFAAKDLLGKNQIFTQGDKIARVNGKNSAISLGVSLKF
jgi:TonB-dependent receptor